MERRRFWMLAPYYVFGGGLGAVLALLVVFGAWAVHGSANAGYAPWIIFAAGLVCAYAASWVLGRGATRLVLDPEVATLTSLTFSARLELRADALPVAVTLTREDSRNVDGPVIAEDTVMTKAVGTAIRKLSATAGTLVLDVTIQDFVVVSAVRRDGSVDRYVGPDLGERNTAAWLALRDWLENKGVPVGTKGFSL